MGDIATSRVPVVFVQGCKYIRQGYAVVLKLRWVGLNLIGFEFTSERVDFDDSLDASKLKSDLPIENRSEFVE
jgi:hypothetical protein